MNNCQRLLDTNYIAFNLEKTVQVRYNGCDLFFERFEVWLWQDQHLEIY